MGLNQSAVYEAVDQVMKFSGQRIAMPNGQYQGECTAPITWYLQYLGLPYPPMANNRADGWGVVPPRELTPFFSFETYDNNRAYPRGSILMWDSPHIVIVLSDVAGDNSVICFEQNADPNGAPCGTYSRVVSNAFHKPTCIMVPVINIPAPTSPPIPYSITPVTPRPLHFKHATYFVDLNYQTTEEINANPITQWPADAAPFMAVAVCNHISGFQFWLPDASVPHGYAFGDCEDYIAPVSTPPPVVTPPAAPVKGTPAEAYNVVTTLPYFESSGQASNHTGVAKMLNPGVYIVWARDDRNNMINLTDDNTKNKNWWINPVDNRVIEEPKQNVPVIPISTPVVQPTPPPRVSVTTPLSPNLWKETYKPFHPDRPLMAVKYVAVEDFQMDDLGGRRPSIQIPEDKEFGLYGWFVKDGIKYYRAKSNADIAFEDWLSVPMVNPHTGFSYVVPSSILEIVPKPVRNMFVKGLVKAELAYDNVKHNVKKIRSKK